MYNVLKYSSLIFSLSLFLFFHQSNSQQYKEEELLRISFDSLTKLADELEYGTNLSKQVYDAQLKKAKFLNDSLQMAIAYRARIWGESFEDAIKYVDSSLVIASKLGDKELLVRNYYGKGVLYDEGDYPKDAIKQYISAYNHSVELDNYEYIVDCINSIASIKREYGHEEEAILLHRKALDYLNENEGKINNFDLTYLITLDNLSRGYLQLNNIDSAKVYTRKGLNLASEMDDKETYIFLSILDAQTNYYDGNFLKSRDSLLKYSTFLEGYSLADSFFYLGMIEGVLGHPEKKKEYFIQVDSILEANNLPLIDNVKTVFQYLLQDALNENDTFLEQKYINRLVHYDKLLDETELNIKKVTLNQFDLPFQKVREEELKSNFETKRKTIYLVFGCIFFAISALVGFLFFRMYNTKRRLNELLNGKTKHSKSSHIRIQKDDLNINEEVIERTLQDLDKWEKELGFLEKDLNQNILAEMVNTNSSYLSKIINTYKNQSFSNYLKDLRITYLINYVKENPESIKNKSIIQIAEEFGFGSVDALSRAFKSKSGITPAVFFRQIKKRNL